MLDLYYASEKPLPLNIDGLYRLVQAKSKAEKEAVDAILEEFFKRTDSGWRNARADSEIAKAQEKSGKARHSAAKRWNCDGNANAMRTHSGRNATNGSDGNAPNNQEPITNNQEPEKKARKRAIPIPEDFGISERVRTWAEGKGYRDLEGYLEFFSGRMRANGKTYIDWDQAFMNCINEDWPGLRKSSGVPDYSQVFANLKD